MSLFTFFGCKFNRHEPVRRDVQWNGYTYVGTCSRCDAQIIRHGRGDWRRHNPDQAEDYAAIT